MIVHSAYCLLIAIASVHFNKTSIHKRIVDSERLADAHTGITDDAVYMAGLALHIVQESANLLSAGLVGLNSLEVGVLLSEVRAYIRGKYIVAFLQ